MYWRRTEIGAPPTDPVWVVFGVGAVKSLPQEIERLGHRRALVLCGPEQESTGRMIADALGDRSAGLLAEARMHVPLEIADLARDRARALEADCCVAVGGGSAIGLGKAVALAHGLPVLAVPTTYAGSEMTPIWGLTENGRKRTGRDPRVLPVSVLYDAEPSPRPHAHGRPPPRSRLQPAGRATGRGRAAPRARRHPDPTRRLWELAGELGAPRSLRQLGMAETDIPRIVDEVLANPYANPVEVTAEGLTGLLRTAWAGEPPNLDHSG
ncbi:iron-containing alcohol dehydrogenase [Nonomuraea sp. NPDC049028]|uniref:iron-containing alcohol dehydrogenase n=1 Tax=Nonomuraea sp. NPDC049028 TaxID=3364348 RepID=UPI003722DEBA